MSDAAPRKRPLTPILSALAREARALAEDRVAASRDKALGYLGVAALTVTAVTPRVLSAVSDTKATLTRIADRVREAADNIAAAGNPEPPDPTDDDDEPGDMPI